MVCKYQSVHYNFIIACIKWLDGSKARLSVTIVKNWPHTRTVAPVFWP